MNALMDGWRLRIAATSAGQWFLGQSQRDRRMLTVLGLFLISVTAYLAVWLPLQDGLTVAGTRHADALADQRWILANRDAVRTIAGDEQAGAGRSGQALLSTVANSARGAGLTLNRFQPEGSDALSVSLEDAVFGDLVIWLEVLNREQGIRVRQASIDAREEPGRVRARLVLH